MSIDPESHLFRYFVQDLTYEQLGGLKQAAELLTDLGVWEITPEILSEALQPEDSPEKILSPEDEDTLFKIISNDSQTAKLSDLEAAVRLFEIHMLQELSSAPIVNREVETAIKMAEGDIPAIREEDEYNESGSVIPTTRRTNSSKLSISPSASQDLLTTGLEECNQCLKMLAFGRSLLGDSTHRKTEKPLTESYNVLGDCLDKLSLALAKLTKGNAMAGVLARDKDNQSHSVASLRLEIERLTDYANEITAENNELMGRLGLFEDEILNLQQQLKKANEAKEEAEERSDYLQINLNQKSKDYEHLNRERADMMTQIKTMADKIKVLEEYV